MLGQERQHTLVECGGVVLLHAMGRIGDPLTLATRQELGKPLVKPMKDARAVLPFEQEGRRGNATDGRGLHGGESRPNELGFDGVRANLL